MSIPRVSCTLIMRGIADVQASYDPRRVFRFSLPDIQVGPKTRAVGTYLSGGLVSEDTSLDLSSAWLCRWIA